MLTRQLIQDSGQGFSVNDVKVVSSLPKDSAVVVKSLRGLARGALVGVNLELGVPLFRNMVEQDLLTKAAQLASVMLLYGAGKVDDDAFLFSDVSFPLYLNNMIAGGGVLLTVEYGVVKLSSEQVIALNRAGGISRVTDVFGSGILVF